LEEIRKTIIRCCRFVPYEKTELTLASLGEDANLIGARECGITGSRKKEDIMPEDLAMIEGEYLRDLLHQPLALENTLASLETSKALQHVAARLNKGRFQRVVLTGMGSSFHALHPLNWNSSITDSRL
jgi:hypothetical protein